MCVYLLTDVTKASVLSDAFIGLTQHRVEGLVAVSPGSPGIARDGECSHIDLKMEMPLNVTEAFTHSYGVRYFCYACK